MCNEEGSFLIYMDHAATTPLRREVLQAMLPYMSEHYANASSSYALARASRRAIDAARAQVAALIGAQSDEIFMTSGGSEADNWALIGAVLALPQERRHIITTQIEHHAILKTCEMLEGFHISVTYLPVNSDGVVDVCEAIRAMSPQTGLISVMLANNEIGTIQPVSQIAQEARKRGILVHTDAVQAVGHIPVDVKKLDVDLLSMSAHKFGGPKGIGALYIRRGTRIGRYIHGGEQEMGMRAGTENTAAIVGMGKAAALASSEMDKSAARLTELRDTFVQKALSKFSHIRINGLSAERLPGHVHMTIDGADTTLLLMQLDMHGIAASSASACAAGVTERSHVLRAITNNETKQADLRFSLGYDTTMEEIDRVIEVLSDLLT